MWTSLFLRVITCLSALSAVTQSCVIQGADTGVCVQPTEDILREMPFCGNVVTYPVCIPRYQGIVARWQNHTLRKKDEWVENSFTRVWDIRKTVELNEAMRESGIDEYGMKGKVIKRFYGGDDAEEDEV